MSGGYDRRKTAGPEGAGRFTLTKVIYSFVDLPSFDTSYFP